MLATNDLSQFYGIILGFSGLGILMNGDHFRKIMDNVHSSAGMQFVFALVGLSFGSYLVIHHNIWVKNWTVILTIVGWALLVDGVIRSLFPAVMANLGKSAGKNHIATGIATLIIGGVLVYFGFGL